MLTNRIYSLLFILALISCQRANGQTFCNGPITVNTCTVLDSYEPLEQFEGPYSNELKHGIWKYSFNGDPIWTAQFVEGKMISQRADYRNGDQLHIESFLSSTGQITFTVFYLTGEVKYKGVVDTDWSFIRFIFYDKEGKQLPPRFNYYWELLSAEHLVALLMMD